MTIPVTPRRGFHTRLPAPEERRARTDDRVLRVPPAVGRPVFGRHVCADDLNDEVHDFCEQGSNWVNDKIYAWSKPVADRDGPFDGWSYIASAKLVVYRVTLLNGWIFSNSPPPPNGVLNFWQRNSLDFDGAPVDWAASILAYTRKHEGNGFPGVADSGHLQAIREALHERGGDPLRYLESVVVSDKDPREHGDDHAVISCLDDIQAASGADGNDPLVRPLGPWPNPTWGWSAPDSAWAKATDTEDPGRANPYVPAACALKRLGPASARSTRGS